MFQKKSTKSTYSYSADHYKHLATPTCLFLSYNCNNITDFSITACTVVEAVV